jgi:molybdenum cofactor cytidylyltransferase
MADLTPIVLAAGASTRMGRPKALLDFDGKTALELALDAVRGYATPIVVLGPNHGEIRQQTDLKRARTVINFDVDLGQTHSLRVALLLLSPETGAFFFMPVDYPLVSAPEVERLVVAYQANHDPAKSIFIPSHSMKRGHPVLCRRELADEFLALRAGASARDVIRRSNDRIAYVEYPEPYVLMDMDTPGDYVRCLEAYRIRNARKP